MKYSSLSSFSVSLFIYLFIYFEQLQLLEASNFHGYSGGPEVFLTILFKSSDLCEGPENKHGELLLPCSKPGGLSRSRWSIKASPVLVKKEGSLPYSKLGICSCTTTFSPEPVPSHFL